MKRILGAVLAVSLIFGGGKTVSAEDYTGGDWRVGFTGTEMVSNFSSADISEAVYALQPGDSVTINLTLENTSQGGAQWYMTNQVLSSLEDGSATARGGAYSYYLAYTDNANVETVLFSSESVGGEKEAFTGLGLHEAAAGMEDYFHLDSMKAGEKGIVTLTVALDGETQGNGYQNTLADLQMNFAVEPLVLTADDGDSGGDGGDDQGSGGQNGPGSGALSYSTGSVKTGDQSNLALWLLAAAASGALLAGLTVYEIRKKKKKRNVLIGVVILSAILLSRPYTAAAEEYTYTVTFYPGNHGSFENAGQVSVDNHRSGSVYRIACESDAVTVSGLRAGDVVSFDAAMEGAVNLGGESKYYVKGIRMSGRDNSTVDTSAFRVEGDRDYVVAYGIRGDMTSYVVNYQDTEGNTLSPGRTGYGNVGDKPVIAFLYIEGYQPQAYNLTKTLSANAAENVFTFTYSRIVESGTNGENPGQGDAGTVPGDASQPGDQTGQNAAAGGQEGGTAGAGGTQDGQTTAGQPDQNTPPDGENEPGTPDENQENLPQPEDGQDNENQIPEGEAGGENGPADTIDLDEQEVPLAGGEGPSEVGGAFFGKTAVVIGISCAAFLGSAMICLWYIRRRRKARERHGSDRKQE